MRRAVACANIRKALIICFLAVLASKLGTMRTSLIATSIVALLVGGCAYRPAFHSQATTAIIIDAARYDGGPSGTIKSTLPIVGGGWIAFIPISRTKESSETHYYLLRTSRGEEIVTQSTARLDKGECVVLWHAPLAQRTNESANFVAGTLERHSGCK
jgi:hypothetical protein